MSNEAKLYTACDKGNVKELETLLLSDINPNWVSPNDFTPLQIACGRGLTEIIRVLIADPRVDVNQADSEGATPIFIACQEGYLDATRLLLEDPRVDANRAQRDGSTPLFVACQNGHPGVVRLLLEYGRGEVNQAMNNGSTPLWIACQNGATLVLKILICSGRKIDLQKKSNPGRAAWEGANPLEIARWAATFPGKLPREKLIEDIIKRRKDCQEVIKILEAFSKDPIQVRKVLRNELRWTKDSARILVFGSLLTENLLQLEIGKEKSDPGRFLAILSRLHFDLQQILCNRTQGLSLDFIPDGEIRLALTDFLQDR